MCATSPLLFLSSSLPSFPHQLTLTPSSLLPGAGLLYSSPPPPYFPFFLPSFLLSIFTIFLSHSSFPPRSLNSGSRFSTHTKGSVSLYYTPPLAQPPNRHTQLFLYASCLQEPPRMSNSLIRALGRQKQPPFLDVIKKKKEGEKKMGPLNLLYWHGVNLILHLPF